MPRSSSGIFFSCFTFWGGGCSSLSSIIATTYAGVAILLIIGQAVVLEALTTLLLRLLRGRTE